MGRIVGVRAGPLEVVPLDFERASIHEVALHDFHDGLREAHAQQRPLDFRMPVDLAQLEETAGDLSGVLVENVMNKLYDVKQGWERTVISAYSPHWYAATRTAA